MAHWIDKKQKTRISDADYSILSKSKKTTIGGEENSFGKSPRDYIEMNIFTTTGTFLDSIRLEEPKQYINVEGEFDINPGIILRRNGYFSGDYEIEFTFLREVAGSNKTVLVDSNKKIYTGEYDVLIDGNIIKSGKPDEYLEEIDYKYFVHQISNDKKEIRLATLPINNESYKAEFEGLGENKSVIYPKIIGQDVLNFDNPSSKPPSNKFVLNTMVGNSPSDAIIKLDNNLVGGELVINDAYEIMDLTEFGAENDGFSIFLQTAPVSEWVKNQYDSIRPGLDNMLSTFSLQSQQFMYGAYKAGRDRINYGDKDNIAGFVGSTGSDPPKSNLDPWRNYCFFDLGIDDGNGFGKATELAKITTKLKGDLGDSSSGRPFLDGAYIMGYKTSKTFGFPFIIATTISDLDKIKKLSPELTIKIKGIDLVSGNEFESTFNPKFYGNGTKGTIPIPTNHKRFGGLYSVEFNLTFDVNGARRGLKIYRPNLFAVIPDYEISDEESKPAEEFIRQGFNY